MSEVSIQLSGFESKLQEVNLTSIDAVRSKFYGRRGGGWSGSSNERCLVVGGH